jgi:DNA repair exonuclease SbcCD ATPase subunit/DNA repair exonuclease SbcCD nuclease subunit
MSELPYYQQIQLNRAIRRIYHISDIHIRLLKRHDEYQLVFNKLYEILRNADDSSVCLLTGDILHSKTELKPECIEMTRKLFIDLSAIMPLIFIAGNHDMLIDNEDRMDSLTPIRNGIPAEAPIYYLEKTGIYRFGNILFSLASVKDYKIIDPQKIQKLPEDITIALFHGEVNGAINVAGIKLAGEIAKDSNKTITPSSFDGYDYVLMGDNHKHQYFRDDRTMAYAGSLIQQDHGESLTGHGVLVWNLTSKTSQLIEIPNESAFLTITMKNGIVENSPDFNKYKHIALRIQYDNSSNSQIEDYVAKLKLRVNITGYTHENIGVVAGGCVGSNRLSASADSLKIIDYNYQNQLIEEFLRAEECSDATIQQIKELNRIANENLASSKTSSGAGNTAGNWKLVSLEFSNLFSFGEGNKIDFTAYKGILGIIAPNHYGKSSILDIILFLLYDKFPRKGSVKDIVNNRKSGFHAVLKISQGDWQYIIEKTGTINKQGRSSVKARFYKYNPVSHVKEILNEDNATKTKDSILKYVGNYEDMIQTNISLQNNNCVFIDAENSERKRELERILQIEFIDELIKCASNMISERKAIMKHILSKKPHDVVLIIEKQITSNTAKLATLGHSVDKLKSSIVAGNLEIARIQQLVIQGVEEKYRELLGNDEAGADSNDSEHMNYRRKLDREYKATYDMVSTRLNSIRKKMGFIDIVEFMDTYETLKTDNSSIVSAGRERIRNINIELENVYSSWKPCNSELKGISMDALADRRLELARIQSFINETSNTIESLGNAENRVAQMEPLPANILADLEEQVGSAGSLATLNNELNECLKPRKHKDNIRSIVDSMLKVNSVLSIKKYLDAYVIKYDAWKSSGGSNSSLKVEEMVVELELLKSKEISAIAWIRQAEEYLEVCNFNNGVSLQIKELKRERDHLDGSISSALSRIQQISANYKNIVDLREVERLLNETESGYNRSIELLTRNKDLLAELEEQCNSNIVNRKLADMEISKVARFQDELERLNKEYKTVDTALTGHKVEYERVKDDLATVVRIEKELEIWAYYVGALKSMPYTIIARVVPLMESIINRFLSNITDFMIKVVVEGNNIDLYIDRPIYNGKPILLNNASGFERFISSIAIRVALMEISQLPKPNFIAIDEGWTSFDNENINNVGTIFDYLKSRFELVISISHLQNIREHCGHHLNLQKDAHGYSYVANRGRDIIVL